MAYITKDTSAKIRKALKEAFPAFKFSVTISNGSSLNVALMQSDMFKSVTTYKSVNNYYLQSNYTPLEANFWEKVITIIKTVGDWYDKSDAMSDYFDTAFYIRLSIGKYDKPHKHVLSDQQLLPKLLVVGHARHGKDTVSEYLAKKLGVPFKGSSRVCCEEFIFHKLAAVWDYKNVEECFEDRVNHRATWHKLIADYCSDNKSAVGQLIYQKHSIYCGIRALDECEAVIKEFTPIVIWVDASKRKLLEPSESMQITKQPNWINIDNNGSEEDLYKTLDELIPYLKKFYGV